MKRITALLFSVYAMSSAMLHAADAVAPHGEAQAEVVPVSIGSSRLPARDDSAGMAGAPEPATTPLQETMHVIAPSVLDRELGTASDGGYQYYEHGQK